MDAFNTEVLLVQVKFQSSNFLWKSENKILFCSQLYRLKNFSNVSEIFLKIQELWFSKKFE